MYYGAKIPLVNQEILFEEYYCMGKTNHAGEEKKLTGNEERFIDYLMKSGYLSDPKIADPEVRIKKQEDNKKIYHNTKLMLQHYRDLVWVMGSIPKDMKAELDIPMADLDKLITRLDVELSLDNRSVESRLQAVIRSRSLVDRMNEAISFLKTKPHEGELLYQIIYHTYIGKKRNSIFDVIDEVGLSKSRYYSLRKKAITMIGIKLWSAPNVKTELWMELLSYFEE